MKKLAESIKRIGLTAHAGKPACRDLVRQAAELIQASDRAVVADAPTAQLAGLDRAATCADTAALTQAVDLLMVFGGDGTMLRVAREAAGSSTPILGINAGGLGFLTDVPAHQLPLALQQIWAGQTILESRPLIEATGRASGQPLQERALNDFVVSGAAPRLIELEVSVNGEVLTRYRCDGLIVCSPTGSTAYSLAAGGAVVSPTADVFAITPICPHTLSNRSVIVGLSSTVQVKPLSEKLETNLSADGQKNIPLSAGDVISIQRSRHSIRLLHLAGSSFFATLRHKLNWSGSNV